MKFEAVFLHVLSSLATDTHLPQQLWSGIAAQYCAPHRHYHTLSHLDTLARELTEVKAHIQHWPSLILAVAYHDIVYVAGATDNEERSASFARRVLTGIVSPAALTRCIDHILATKAHLPNEEEDVNYFTDADLSILGRPEPEYSQYRLQVRKEYSMFPDALYQAGRVKVLRSFLSMPEIYKTTFFFDKYEAQARINIKDEIRELERANELTN